MYVNGTRTSLHAWLQTHLLHSISKPHDLCRLPAGLGLGGVQDDIQVGYIGESRVNLLIWVHEMLNLSHGELSVWRVVIFTLN